MRAAFPHDSTVNRAHQRRGCVARVRAGADAAALTSGLLRAVALAVVLLSCSSAAEGQTAKALFQQYALGQFDRVLSEGGAKYSEFRRTVRADARAWFTESSALSLEHKRRVVAATTLEVVAAVAPP